MEHYGEEAHDAILPLPRLLQGGLAALDCPAMLHAYVLEQAVHPLWAETQAGFFQAVLGRS